MIVITRHPNEDRNSDSGILWNTHFTLLRLKVSAQRRALPYDPEIKSLMLMLARLTIPDLPSL
jgi:hypothetical protein